MKSIYSIFPNLLIMCARSVSHNPSPRLAPRLTPRVTALISFPNQAVLSPPSFINTIVPLISNHRTHHSDPGCPESICGVQGRRDWARRKAGVKCHASLADIDDPPLHGQHPHLVPHFSLWRPFHCILYLLFSTSLPWWETTHSIIPILSHGQCLTTGNSANCCKFC